MTVHYQTIRSEKGPADRIAELTFQLLVHCQIKESTMAEEFSMSSSELRALRLFQGVRHLPQKEIIDRVGLSGSRLTRILDGFRERGWVTRAEDPDDRRGAIIFLTPAGLDLVQVIERRSVAIHSELLSGVPLDEQPGLVRSLEVMLSSLQRWAARRQSGEISCHSQTQGNVP